MVINIRTVALSHSELGQYDTDIIIAQLKEKGADVYLSEATVTFVMKHEKNNSRYTITCSLEEDGSVVIPLTYVETSISGLYFCQLIVSCRKLIRVTIFSPYLFPDKYFSEKYFGEFYFSGYFSENDSYDIASVHTFPSSGYVTIKIERAL